MSLKSVAVHAQAVANAPEAPAARSGMTGKARHPVVHLHARRPPDLPARVQTGGRSGMSAVHHAEAVANALEAPADRSARTAKARVPIDRPRVPPIPDLPAHLRTEGMSGMNAVHRAEAVAKALEAHAARSARKAKAGHRAPPANPGLAPGPNANGTPAPNAPQAVDPTPTAAVAARPMPKAMGSSA